MPFRNPVQLGGSYPILRAERRRSGKLRAVEPVDQLPEAEIPEHLGSLARKALLRYGLEPDAANVRPAAESFNTIFRVAGDGRTYALRVGPAERIHAEGTEIVEARWMRELRAGGVICPPEVFDSLDGSPVVRQADAGVRGARVCMLFDWVDGVPVSETMNLDAAQEMGRLAAQLAESAPTVDQPTEPPLIADRILYWQIENRLPQLVAHRSLIDEALERAQQVLDDVWGRRPHSPQLIHGDLTPHNVLVSDGRLVPIDFQDLVWGFDVQDLANSLSSLAPFDDAEALREQFRSGYEDIRAWPDLDDATLAGLVAGRWLHQLNLSLTLRRPGLSRHIDRALALIAEWMS